ncbi:unnamed protein product [Rhizophagus irregularis]|uniref:Uncharacterized protein n=1 Tax=Rhizophagus irregularis TaxID=588596 RepID=A0A2I1GN27_9GLOM|nr:hypothetical protein RhiirA4_421800 [Rhizophagus irregularis]CAB4420882.1 unnamed protein product [Rhizophagus irregularis]
MERATNELLINEDFVKFLHNNTLYTNGSLYFKILDQAIKKHVDASQHKKHLFRAYLWDTFTSLLERFERELQQRPSPPITKTTQTSQPYFPIKQQQKVPIKKPSDDFWIRSRALLDAFFTTFWNLPTAQQIITFYDIPFSFYAYLERLTNHGFLDDFNGLNFGSTFTWH